MRAAIKCVGKYELKALLVQMPSCAVYDGWDPDLDLRVAVKLIPLSAADNGEAREVLDRFRRGAKAAAQLHHPNIVSVYNYGETEDHAYLVMEFVEGPTLKTRFETEHFELPEICGIIGGILEALQYSHERGVVHRDIKPSNIMFTRDNKVKIVDFGIARLEDGGAGYDSELTTAGMRIGAPAYMSPEQWLTEKADARTDIYSTGVVLYQMLTGEAPFEGTQDTIMRKVLYGSLMLPSHLSKSVTQSLDRVVTRAMEKQREDRFESAAAFNAALQKAFRSVDPVVPPPPQRKSRSWVPLLGLLMLATLGAGGSAAWWFAKPGPGQGHTLASEPKPAEPLAELPRVTPADPLPEAARFVPPVEQPRPPYDPVSPPAGSENVTRTPPAPFVSPTVPPGGGAQELTPVPDVKLALLPEFRLPPPVPPKPPVVPAKIREPGPVASGKDPAASRGLSLLPPDFEKSHNRPAPTAEPPPPVRTFGCGYAHASELGFACIPAADSAGGDPASGGGAGIIVLGVTAQSAAERAGFRKNDVIVKINGSDVHDLSMLSKFAGEGASGHIAPVEVMRNGTRQTLNLAVDLLRH